MNWKSILASVAPILGTAIGGPLGGAAAKVIGDRLLGKKDASEAEIAEAIIGATPEQLLKIKGAEQDFKRLMKELDINLEALHAEDRDSARKREVDAGDSATPRILAALVTIAFAGVLTFLIGWPLALPNTEVIYLLLGTLSAAWMAVINYYFGSSSSSKEKNKFMRK